MGVQGDCTTTRATTNLEELHAGHPGVARMKGLARTIVWWPRLDGDIKRRVQGCFSCQETRNEPPKAPLHPWSWPHQPWMRVHVDEGARGLRWTLVRKYVSCTHCSTLKVD